MIRDFFPKAKFYVLKDGVQDGNGNTLVESWRETQQRRQGSSTTGLRTVFETEASVWVDVGRTN